MNLFKSFLIIGCVFVLLSSCATIFYTPDANTLASNHSTIAIMPPIVSIKTNKQVDTEILKQQEKIESMNFHKCMHSWMLKRKMQGKIVQNIQEIEITNAKLLRVGFPEKPLTTAELCKVLGVDGILTSNYELSKPMSEVAAAAVLVLYNVMGTTNKVHAIISISDCNDKKVIWNYDHTFSGSIGSTPSKIVKHIMRASSKKMPYMN